MAIGIMSKLVPFSTMERKGRGWPKLPSLYEEHFLSDLSTFVDLNWELLISPLVILLDILLLAKFFKSSLSIYNFFVWFSVFFLSFNGANCPRDVFIFTAMFGGNLPWLMLDHLRSLLTFGFTLSNCDMSIDTWCLSEEALCWCRYSTWWPFYV